MTEWLEGNTAVESLKRMAASGEPEMGLKFRNADCGGISLNGLILAECVLQNISFKGASFENARLSECQLEGINLDRTNLKNASFFKVAMNNCSAVQSRGYRWSVLQSKINFLDATSAFLPEAKFVHTSMSDVNLSKANLDNAAFTLSPQNRTDFTAAYLKQTTLFELNLRSCIFLRVNAPYVVMSGSNLDGMNFEGANLTFGQFNKSSLKQTIFSGNDLSGACFVDSRLNHANLDQCNLTNATFLRCDLSGSSLKHAIFSKARATRTQFSKSSLNGLQATQSIWHLANLQGADCRNAVFTNADLIGSNLTDANFEGATLREARLDLTQKDGAKFDFGAIASASHSNKDYAAYVMANS